MGIFTQKEPKNNREPWQMIISGNKYNSDGSFNLGHISDGYHTFDELYEHRTVLFASLCSIMHSLHEERVFWSTKHSDGTMFKDMFIAGILTEDGWVCYHIDKSYWRLFKNLPERSQAPVFDGATPKDGLERLIKEFLFKEEN